MSEAAALPDSILVYDPDEEFRHPDLDLTYIDELAVDLAKKLRSSPVDVAYQPGDGSSYSLVIVPLDTLATGKARVVQGSEWNAHAFSGDLERHDGVGGIAGLNRRTYRHNRYLICKEDGGAFTYGLGAGDHGEGLAYSWLGPKLRLSNCSAVSVTLLLRAISHHLTEQGQ